MPAAISTHCQSRLIRLSCAAAERFANRCYNARIDNIILALRVPQPDPCPAKEQGCQVPFPEYALST